MDVGGTYELIAQVATSASGSLWRARDRRLDRDVALKQVSASAVESAQRLRREAQLLAGLSHTNIVEVFDLLDEAGQLWLVEEWVDGIGLDVMLQRCGQLRPQQAVGVIAGALEGLAYAHGVGLVHRDVSPTNILLTTDGTSKLVDFGLAAPTGMPGVAGTPGYLSPEAAHGRAVGQPADVYSTAAVLAMLLRGRPLFAGSTAEAVIGQQLNGAPPDLEGVDRSMRAALRQALAENPNSRFPDAGAFLTALRQAADEDYGPAWYAEAGVAALVTAVLGTAIAGGNAGVVGSGIAGPLAVPPVPPPSVPSVGPGFNQLGESTPPGVQPAVSVSGNRSPLLQRAVVRPVRRMLAHPVIAGGIAVVVVVAAVGVSVAAGHHSGPRAAPAPVTTSPIPSRSSSVTGSVTPTASASPILAASVRACPIPAAQLGGASPGVVPVSTAIPASVQAPAGSAVSGTGVPARGAYYILGPAALTCSPGFGSADGGFSQSLSQPGATTSSVSYLFSAGGAGPNQTLACGYIAAATDAAGGQCVPAPLSSDSITKVTTGDASVEAALVATAAGATDPNLGAPPSAGLVTYAVFVVMGEGFTCQGGCGAPSVEASQRAACALPADQVDYCRAALAYFVTQSLAAGTPAQAPILSAIEGLH